MSLMDEAKMPSLKDKIREESEKALAEIGPAPTMEPEKKKKRKLPDKVGGKDKKLTK